MDSDDDEDDSNEEDEEYVYFFLNLICQISQRRLKRFFSPLCAVKSFLQHISLHFVVMMKMTTVMTTM